MATYHIQTPAQLQAMNDDLSGNYILDNNIDLTGVDWEPIGWGAVSENSSEPSNPFIGTFDGQGYTISNLTCTRNVNNTGYYGTAGDCGLFGAIGSSSTQAVIHDLNLYNITIYAVHSGGFAGSIYYADIYNINIDNADFYGTEESGTYINQFTNVGGFAGKITGSYYSLGNRYTLITNCHVSNATFHDNYTLNGSNGINIAGFVSRTNSIQEPVFNGSNNQLIIFNCSASNINMSYVQESGGFSTLLFYATVHKCYSSGYIYCAGESVCGGFSAYITCGITYDCYSEVDITTYDKSYNLLVVGGFVGYLSINDTIILRIQSIYNCYSSGDIILNGTITNAGWLGGFAGIVYPTASFNWGTNRRIKNSYFGGSITNNLVVNSGTDIGGFAGYFYDYAYKSENLSWYTGSCTQSVGFYTEYLTGIEYNNVATLASISKGWDETNVTTLYFTTADVYRQGEVDEWDFTSVWETRINNFPWFGAIIDGDPIDGTTLGTFVSCGEVGLVFSEQDVNLDHLEGETVGVVANGIYLGEQTVSTGAITLPADYSKLQVGLPYNSDLETLSLKLSADESKKVKIGNVTFRLIDTKGGNIGNDETSIYEAFTDRAFELSFGVTLDETEMFTGDVRVPLGAGYNKGRVFIRQSDPMPITVSAIIPEVTVGKTTR